MGNWLRVAIWIAAVIWGTESSAAGCGEGALPVNRDGTEGPQPARRYQVIARRPHDPGAFTEGLVFHRGNLYESTGLYGRSSLRRIDPATGKITRIRGLPPALFGEGLALVGDVLVQLTWRQGWVLLYRPETLESAGRRRLAGEGWGITVLQGHLVTSDGSDTLTWRNPTDLSIERRIRIRDRAGPVAGLNELESVQNRILANVWPTDCIAEIDPNSGMVTAWLDVRGLRPPALRRDPSASANGIAYDPDRHRLFVTGKRWPYLYVLSTE